MYRNADLKTDLLLLKLCFYSKKERKPLDIPNAYFYCS